MARPTAFLELGDAVGQDGDAAFPGAPVAGRQIVKNLGQAVGLEALGERVLVEIIGEKDIRHP